jgi:hypothetical protein
LKHAADIWLGDLLRAFDALQPGDESTRALVARMAGFDWMPARPPDTVAGPEVAPAAKPAEAAVRPPPSPPPEPPAEDSQQIEEELPLVGTSAPEPAPGWRSVPPLDPYPAGIRPSLPYLPLFRPEWCRTLVTTLASVPLPIGPVDEARLVVAIARGSPVRHIPRRPKWSLALGVQFLVDVARGMEPFAGDQTRLLALFQECVGCDQTHDIQFADCPSRGVFDEEDALVPYRLPDPGVPVVAVTDAGLGPSPSHLGRSQPGEWIALSRRLRAQRSPLRLLVPCERARWPAELREAVCLVEWDRPTTVGTVRRLSIRYAA